MSVPAAWFAYRVAREYRGGRGLRALVSEHHAPHLLHSAAMLYMFLALRPPASAPRLPHHHGRHDGVHAHHHDLTSHPSTAAPRNAPVAQDTLLQVIRNYL